MSSDTKDYAWLAAQAEGVLTSAEPYGDDGIRLEFYNASAANGSGAIQVLTLSRCTEARNQLDFWKSRVNTPISILTGVVSLGASEYGIKLNVKT